MRRDWPLLATEWFRIICLSSGSDIKVTYKKGKVESF
jgi:hypothetical protein